MMLPLTLAGAVYLLIGFALVTGPFDPFSLGFGMIAGPFGAWFGIRTWRSRVEFHDSELVIRGLMRTRRVPWSEIRLASIGGSWNSALIPWRVLVIHRSSGHFIRVGELAALGRWGAEPLGEAVDRINRTTAPFSEV